MSSYVGNSPINGKFLKIDDIASQFNGVLTDFLVRVDGVQVRVGSSTNLILTLNKLVQNPNVDYILVDTVEGFSVIRFTTAPTIGTTFYALQMGEILDTAEIPSGTLTSSKLASDSVTTPKIQNNAVTEAKIASNAVTVSKIANETITFAKINPTSKPSESEAIAGVLDNKFMTPLSTKQAMSNALPSGAIIMWSGTIATIPAGYLFCDGQNGTPNLRDRMIVCGSQDSGGFVQTMISGALTRFGGIFNGLTGGRTLTTNQLASHQHLEGGNHELFDGVTPGGSNGFVTASGLRNANRGNFNIIRLFTDFVGGNQPHDHTVDLPPYYALAFIMKA
jgi:hypothetical protein